MSTAGRRKLRNTAKKTIAIGGGSNDMFRQALAYQSLACMCLGQHGVAIARDLLTEAFQLWSETLEDRHDTSTRFRMLALRHCSPNDPISSQHATSTGH